MTKLTPEEIMSALDTILEEEREALSAGDLTKVSDLMHRKSELIDMLGETGEDTRPVLDTLKTKAMRNQVLLDGAMDGIRNVARRLAELRKLRYAFDTYDETGQRRTITADAQHKVEKRA